MFHFAVRYFAIVDKREHNDNTLRYKKVIPIFWWWYQSTTFELLKEKMKYWRILSVKLVRTAHLWVTSVIRAIGNFASSNHGLSPEKRKTTYQAPNVLGKNVWIGSNATILQGVTIGDNAVVAANTVAGRRIRWWRPSIWEQSPCVPNQAYWRCTPSAKRRIPAR